MKTASNSSKMSTILYHFFTNIRKNYIIRDVFLLFLFFSTVIYAFDSLGVHPDVATRGADMNYVFNLYHHDEPKILAQEALKWGTFLVMTDKSTGKPVHRESGAIEVGYYILIQQLGLWGFEMNEITLAQFHVFVFLINSFLFALVVGIVTRRVFPVSFIILSLLLVFRYQNEPLIYYVVGVWTLATSFPLLIIIALLLIGTYCIPLSRKSALLLIAIGILGGTIGMFRESEAYVFLFSSIVFIILYFITFKIRNLRNYTLAVTLLILILSFSVATPIINESIIYHRAWKTGLEPKEYGSGFSHGAWHVLVVSLGRYENPYGYYYSDYFAIDTAEKLLREKGMEGGWFSPPYMAVLGDYYFEQIYKHPTYYLKYLLKSTLDYVMFLPYSLFLNDPSRSPIGAHLPVIKADVIYDPQDYVWHDRMMPNGDVPKDTTALKNLKLRYFYLTNLNWIIFLFTLLIVVGGPFLIAKYYQRDILLFVIGMYMVFFFESILRILIPMHGWTATLTYYAIFAVNIALLSVYFFKNMLNSKFNQEKLGKQLRFALLMCLLFLVLIKSLAGVNFAHTKDDMLRDNVPSLPKLLEEGFKGYNIVLFNDKYYGINQGFLPNYSDPDIDKNPNVVVGTTINQTKELISLKS